MNKTFFDKMIKIFFIIATLVVCESVYIYSSFWAPLFNPRILNYRVDLNLDPEIGKKSREEFAAKYGYRGEKIIADFGNGRGPTDPKDSKDYGDVKFYYTYPEARILNRR